MTTNPTAVAVQRPEGFPLARLGDYGLFLIWATQGTANLVRTFRHIADRDLLGAAHVATVTVVLFVFAIFFLRRGPAGTRHAGLLPKLIAFAGTWSILPLASLPLTWRPGWLMTVTTLGLIGAYAWVLWSILTLRRNLSIFPEARELVRHGPYGLVRHPLYIGHIACYALIALPRIGPWALALVVAGIAAELARARYEEKLLAGVFPGYAAYAAETPRFLPDLRRLLVPRKRGLTGPAVAIELG